MKLFKLLATFVITVIRLIIFIQTIATAVLFFNKIFVEIRKRLGYKEIDDEDIPGEEMDSHCSR